MVTIQRTLTFLFALLISMAAAAHDIEVANSDGVTIYYSFIKNNTELEVTYKGDKWDSHANEYIGNVIIPASVIVNDKNYPVTSIGTDAFEYCRALSSVNIPNSVISIEDNAFYYCSSLKNITIPNSVTAIGNNAFYFCSSLKSITIPNSVKTIGGNAFCYCSDLTNVTIPNSVTSMGNHAFRETAWFNNQPDGLVYAGKVASQWKGTMPANTSIVLKNGTLGIAGGAFKNCSGLTSIIIPNSVTNIGEYAFSSCTGLTSINIPNSVETIGNYAFEGCSGLTSINIPNSVTSSMFCTFYNCSSLTSISLPSSMTIIGGRIFDGCSQLRCVIIPNSVTSIEYRAFQNCYNLTDVYCYAKTLPSASSQNTFSSISSATLHVPAVALEDYKATAPWNGFGTIMPIEDEPVEKEAYAVLSTDRNTLSFYFDNKKDNREGTVYTADEFRTADINSWGEYSNDITTVVFDESFAAYQGATDYWFYNCRKLETIQGMDNLNVMSIGYYSFAYCISLLSLTMPSSVTSIGDYAFGHCSGLTSVTIGNSVTSIGDYVFSGCSGLTSVTIPNSVTSIGDYVFSSCSGLTSVAIPNSVISIGDYAFNNCSGLTSVAIPNGITSIGSGAFYGCRGLTSVTIPSSMTSIGDYAFNDCSGLTSIIVEESNPTYDSRDNCNAIIETATNKLVWGCMNTVIPNSVTSIENYAFSNCSGLISVTIPNSVTSIGEYAFYGCSGLKSMTIGNSVTSIGYEAFYDCSGLTSLTIPSSVTSIGSCVFLGCSGLTSINVDSDNTVYDSRNNCNAIIKTAANELIVGCQNTIIPNSVASIADYAFYQCSGLASVTIPNSVTSIGRYVFYKCGGLTSITIPNSVITIGNYAFGSCSSLTSVIIPNSITSIEGAVFYACSGLTSVTIPNSVTNIGYRAFAYCSSLTFVSIPNSVNSIESEAFRRCTNMTDIYCYSEQLPTTERSVFYNTNNANATLHVPASALESYRSTAPWSGFGTIVPIDEEDEDDLQRYLDSLTDNEDQIADGVYKRQFKNGHWQTLYLPFAINYADWSTQFEAARISAFRQYDDDGNGVVDRQELEATKMESGTLESNTPYLIRAKSGYGATFSVSVVSGTTPTAGSAQFVGDDATLTITGTYQPVTGMKTARRYRLQGGTLFIPSTDTEVLPSYRWYATISGQAASRPLTVRFSDGTTAVMAAGRSGGDASAVYDLRGRRIDTSDPSLLPKGIYIIDGRKYTVK